MSIELFRRIFGLPPNDEHYPPEVAHFLREDREIARQKERAARQRRAETLISVQNSFKSRTPRRTEKASEVLAKSVPNPSKRYDPGDV